MSADFNPSQRHIFRLEDNFIVIGFINDHYNVFEI